MSWSTCKYCGEKIVWAQMPYGQWLPMDPYNGGRHECFVPTPQVSPRSVWRYRDDDFCRPTSCPRCGADVYFVRHNGGSVWFDDLGKPWPKHACFYDDPIGYRLREDLRSLAADGKEAVFGVIIETVATRPGEGGRIIIRCSDGTMIDREFNTDWDLKAVIGKVVRVEQNDGVARLIPINPSNDQEADQGVIIETIAAKPGEGGRIIVRCSDGTMIDTEVNTELDLATMVGQAVRIERKDGNLKFILIDT